MIELQNPILTVIEDKMMKTGTLGLFLTFVAAASAASPSQYEEQLSIHTLAPRDRAGAAAGIHVADALLSDWEGDHWVSLDAELDKVSLSWTTDAEHITFQVSKGKTPPSFIIEYYNHMHISRILKYDRLHQTCSPKIPLLV